VERPAAHAAPVRPARRTTGGLQPVGPTRPARRTSPDARPGVPGPTRRTTHGPWAPSPDLVAAALSTVTAHSVVVLDPDLRYQAVAGAAHGHPSYGADALVGRRARDVLPARVWAAYEPLLRDALEGRTRSVTVPSEVTSATVEVTCSPVRSADAILGVVAVAREVGGPSAAALASHEELELTFGLTFEHSPICQALLTPDGRLTRVNRTFCALLGAREADLVGRDFQEITDPRDHGIGLGWIARLRSGELDHYALPSRLLHADGTVIRVHVRLSAARAADGELRGFVAQLLDLHH
jgi:PAS domain S-box-containing protein